jgi:predicted site-specific integrase-resolvase
MHNDSATANFISSAEVATRLGFDRATLTRWIQMGRITPAQKLRGRNGTYLFTEEEFERVKDTVERGRVALDLAVAARAHAETELENARAEVERVRAEYRLPTRAIGWAESERVRRDYQSGSAAS